MIKPTTAPEPGLRLFALALVQSMLHDPETCLAVASALWGHLTPEMQEEYVEVEAVKLEQAARLHIGLGSPDMTQ